MEISLSLIKFYVLSITNTHTQHADYGFALYDLATIPKYKQ